MSKVIIDFYRVHGEPPNEFDVSQHREIYEAILSKDPSRAREAMGKHLSYTANLLLKSFHPGDNDHGRD
jgi:DNA-binding GntR family transcriptional regulator